VELTTEGGGTAGITDTASPDADFDGSCDGSGFSTIDGIAMGQTGDTAPMGLRQTHVKSRTATATRRLLEEAQLKSEL
jgi:hypothetical protein